MFYFHIWSIALYSSVSFDSKIPENSELLWLLLLVMVGVYAVFTIQYFIVFIYFLYYYYYYYYYFTPCEFFTPALAGGLSLESE